MVKQKERVLWGILSKNEAIFIAVFCLVFLFLIGVLSLFNLIPESIYSESAPTIEETKKEAVFVDPAVKEVKKETTQSILPTRIVIKSVGIDTRVNNPNSTDVTTLNTSLQSGAVRYPGSGTLLSGNMFVFGHSSRLAVVHNMNYKAFNNLKDVKVGDIIDVYSQSVSYKFKVSDVSTASKYDTWVKFEEGVRKITLSTCDRFTSATARTVVVGEFLQ